MMLWISYNFVYKIIIENEMQINGLLKLINMSYVGLQMYRVRTVR